MSPKTQDKLERRSPLDVHDPPTASDLSRRYLTLTELGGQRLFDRQARKYLKMSGAEFRERFEAGELDPHDMNVNRISMLMPFDRRRAG